MRLDAVKDYKVLIVGDAVYDRYAFVTVPGKSMKEPTLSANYEREEIYRGGIWAAAAHLGDLCSVDVWHGPNVPTYTRYVEEVYNRKLMTLHQSQKEVCGELPDIKSYDVVIVLDFGHGTMSQQMIEKVTKEARFLAVNAQTNSNNMGFNLITAKYRRADYVVLDELEARLAAHDRDSPIEDVILKLGYRKIIVTMGARGAVGFDGDFYREKALADRVVDTIGAGDAFLCVSAPFAAALFSVKDLVRIGSVAGAIKCGILGHRAHVTREELERHL